MMREKLDDVEEDGEAGDGDGGRRRRGCSLGRIFCCCWGRRRGRRFCRFLLFWLGNLDRKRGGHGWGVGRRVTAFRSSSMSSVLGVAVVAVFGHGDFDELADAAA